MDTRTFLFVFLQPQKINEDKPRILYSLYFTLMESSIKNLTEVPPNLFLCSGPNFELDFDSSINQVSEPDKFNALTF